MALSLHDDIETILREIGYWRLKFNVADLRTRQIFPTQIGALVVVEGAATRGDGGGGLYYWDNTSAADDDGINVIKPNSNPATGRWVRVPSLPGDSSEVIVVAPGANRAAAINAAITTLAATATATRKKTVQLQRGQYTLETAIVAKDNVVLRGEGDQTVLVPTFTGAADDLANAVIKVDGAIDVATMNTSLTADVSKNAASIAVAAAGAIAAGRYVLIAGNNGGGQGYAGDLGMSDGIDVVLEEVARVGSGYAGGLTLPTAWPLLQSHAGPVKATVKALTPVVGFELRDLQILGSSGVTTAVGVLVRYAVNTQVHNVTASGCSRSAISVRGSKGFRSSGFRSLGTLNGWYHLQSVLDGEVWGFSGADDVARNHASGTPRWQIHMWARCTAVHVHDGVLSGGNGGLFHSGGVGCVFENVKARNQQIDVATYNRRVASAEWLAGGVFPLGFGSGAGPLNLAEFAAGCIYDNLSTDDLFAENAAPFSTLSPPIAVALYIHDTHDFVAAGLAAVNVGIGATRVAGVVLSDCRGAIGALFVQGLDFGLRTSNVYADVEIASYVYAAKRADAGNALNPLYLDHTAVSGRGPRIQSCKVSNAFSFLPIGPAAGVDPAFLIRNLVTDQGEWDYAILANNQTGTAFNTGDVVEIDPTYAGADLRIRTPDTGAAGYERRLAAVASGAAEGSGTGILLIAPLPQMRASVKATAAAVAYGDRIGYAATRRAVTDAAAGTLGVARTRKAAGAEGMVTIGPTT